MSELILTPDEKKSTWAECDDKCLADVLRHCLAITGNINSNNNDVPALTGACDGLSLIRMAHETNSDIITIEQGGVTVKGENIGDYEIVVRKVV